MITDLLDTSKINQQGYFNAGFVEKLKNEHMAGKKNHSHLLWALMVFQKWYNIYGKG